MFRKTFLVNVVFVLCVLVVMMILLGGCGSSTPVPTATFTPPTPVPTIALTPTALPSKTPPFYMTPPPLPPCDPPYLIPFEEIVGATFRYLDAHYPEQKAPIFPSSSSGCSFGQSAVCGAVCVSGDWSLAISSQNPAPVIATNDSTGFNWQGRVYYREVREGCGTVSTEITSVTEISVTIAPTHIPIPTPTKSVAERSKIFLKDSVTSVAFSPDSKILGIGNFDNTIILWDVSNPKSPAQILWDVSPTPTPNR